MNRMLIVGATGVLGSPATKYFLQKNFLVKAFVRNKDKAAALEKAGANIFVGDRGGAIVWANIKYYSAHQSYSDSCIKVFIYSHRSISSRYWQDNETEYLWR